MPMTTPSGAKTYKFDQVVPDEVKEELDRHNGVISEYQQYKINSDKRFTAIERDYGTLRNTVDTILLEMANDHKRTLEVAEVMCKSRFFRILNGIFGWYIIGDVRIYANRAENEKYGRPPFSTRLARQLKRVFLEQPALWIHTIFTKEPVETTQEEYTNDEERIQPPEE